MIGTVLDERYLIMALLGQGSTSVVYKAEHQLMKRIVAIKMLLSHTKTDPTNIERFKQEARAISALKHPNLVAVYDFGITTAGDPYLVMDLVEGESLSAVLERERHLSPQRIVPMAIQACAALSYAHEQGIIHRDVKPGNIMITRSEDGGELVKLLDFGIARLLGPLEEQCQRLTKTGEIFGSPLYFSPEQCIGREIDGRSDIYSLGCVLFEALCGQPPFSARTSAELASKHLLESPVWPADCQPVPDDLRSIVIRAMEKDPQKRFGTSQQMSEALSRAAPGLQTQAENRTFSLAHRIFQQTAGPDGRRRLWLAALLCAMLLTGIFLVWLNSTPPGQLYWERRSFDQQALSLTADDPRLLAAAETLAEAMEKAGQSAQAVEMLRRIEKNSNASFIRIPDPKHSQTWYQLGQQLIKIQTRLYGSESSEVGETLWHMANLCMTEQHMPEAIQLYERSIAIQKKHRPGSDRTLGWTYNNLGLCFDYEKQFGKAQSVKSNAVALMKKYYGQYDQTTIRGLSSLADSYRSDRQFKKACDLYAEALKLQLEWFHPNPRLEASLSTLLAASLEQSGNLSDAEQHYLDAAQINGGLELFQEAGDNWRYIAFCELARHHYAQSETAFRKALNCYSKVPRVNPQARALAQEGLHHALIKLGKNLEAGPKNTKD